LENYEKNIFGERRNQLKRLEEKLRSTQASQKENSEEIKRTDARIEKLREKEDETRSNCTDYLEKGYNPDLDIPANESRREAMEKECDDLHLQYAMAQSQLHELRKSSSRNENVD
jgi:uncharacterized coiled-coil DUF342 family protein